MVYHSLIVVRADEAGMGMRRRSSKSGLRLALTAGPRRSLMSALLRWVLSRVWRTTDSYAPMLLAWDA